MTTPETTPQPEDTTTTESGNGLYIEISADEMRVYLNGAFPAYEVDVVIEDIRAAFLEHNLHLEFCEAHVQEKIALCKAQGAFHFENFVLVEGEYPTEPIDGHVEWARDFFSPEFVTDEKTGAVDYRRRVGDPTVSENELLAWVQPPVQGQNGVNVYGRAVPARLPRRVILNSGLNVKATDLADGRIELRATTNGRVRLLGEKVVVDEVYIISGDVGLQTGNISHFGAVIVRGDVKSGSRITANGDIEVSGIIEPATIHTDGDLIVHGGIIGAPEHRITVQGHINARYIQSATIECERDIHVASMIRNSTLRTHGRLLSPGGAVVGGSVMALQGILIGKGGSEGLISTQLIAAEDFSLLPTIEELTRQINELRKKGAILREIIDPMMESQHELGLRSRIMFLNNLARLSEYCLQAELIQQQIDDLKENSRVRSCPLIFINDEVCPETHISMHDHSMSVKQKLTGPLRFCLVNGEVAMESTKRRTEM